MHLCDALRLRENGLHCLPRTKYYGQFCRGGYENRTDGYLFHEKRYRGNVFAEATFAKIPCSLRERLYKIGFINKVFASQWLSYNKIVMGTKCNKLVILDVLTGKHFPVPVLTGSSVNNSIADSTGGQHAIEINPSGTLLAAGAENPADLGIYRLPSLEPVTIGEGAHRDWIFGMQWLDDQYLLSGSRDSTVALWKFSENAADDVTCKHVTWVRSTVYPIPVTSAILVKRLSLCEKVRALSYSYQHRVVATVSLNSRIYLLDLERLTQVSRKKLHSDLTECVCLRHSPDESMIAIGCRSHCLLFDARSLQQIAAIKLPLFSGPARMHINEVGVRSLSWRNYMLTLGTGGGEILFYDERNRSFLQCGDCERNGYETLKVGSGWLYQDEIFEEVFVHPSNVPTAVYTHCYDSGGSRLFAAGGPIAASLIGNYAGLWQ